jgi:hypothetical protein
MRRHILTILDWRIIIKRNVRCRTNNLERHSVERDHIPIPLFTSAKRTAQLASSMPQLTSVPLQLTTRFKNGTTCTSFRLSSFPRCT